MAESIVVLLFYPVFAFSCQRLLVIKPKQKAFDQILQAAETHGALIRRYGPIGLFAFVLLPFPMTGPVVGCAIGFLLRMPVWLNMTMVLSAVYVAVFLRTFLFQRLHSWVSAYSPMAALIMVIVIVVVVFGRLGYERIREKRQRS